MSTADQCRVGRLSCFSFFLLILYAVGLVTFVFGVGISKIWDKRAIIMPRLRPRASHASGFGGMPLEDPVAEESDRPSTHSSTSAPYGRNAERRARSGSSGYDTVSPAHSLSRQRLGRGASLLEADPMASYQPRTYALNTYLSDAFYSIGYFAASKPFLTIAMAFVVCGLLNSGWANFQVERDPVKLWVAKGSASEVNKNFFDEQFGPFYRTEQIFVSLAPASTAYDTDSSQATSISFTDQPVLNFERLQWWAAVEADIRSLRSSVHGYTLQDVCFAPAGPASDPSECVVQSLMGYFGDSLGGVDEGNWATRLDACAQSPAFCLPSSGLPLNPRLLFGGIPGYSGHQDYSKVAIKASQARALVVTYVVSNSLNATDVARAEEWESTLRDYLGDLARRAPAEAGLQLSYSTGVSLEEELNKSTNTDVPIVILSYLVMFLYVSVSLGGTASGILRLFTSLFRAIYVRVMIRFGRDGGQIRLSTTEDEEQEASTRTILHRVLINSKFLLGLWGIIS